MLCPKRDKHIETIPFEDNHPSSLKPLDNIRDAVAPLLSVHVKGLKDNAIGPLDGSSRSLKDKLLIAFYIDLHERDSWKIGKKRVQRALPNVNAPAWYDTVPIIGGEVAELGSPRRCPDGRPKRFDIDEPVCCNILAQVAECARVRFDCDDLAVFAHDACRREHRCPDVRADIDVDIAGTQPPPQEGTVLPSGPVVYPNLCGKIARVKAKAKPVPLKPVPGREAASCKNTTGEKPRGAALSAKDLKVSVHCLGPRASLERP